MSNLTGLFLGAGASRDLAMPLVWDLTKDLKSFLTPSKLQSLNAFGKAKGFGFADKEISTLEKLLGMPGLHYEAILGHLEVQFRRAGPLQQPNYYGLYSWLAEVVYTLLYHCHIRNVAFIEANLHRLVGILDFIKANAPLWVFSLNHDLIIECFAAQYGIPLNCGFSNVMTTFPRREKNGTKIGDLTAETISIQQVENGMPFWPSGQAGINLLKIHGSLDVFSFRDGEYLARLIPQTNTVSELIGSLRAANEELIYVDPNRADPVRTYNEITFADDAGVMQFLRRTLLSGAFKFDNRFSQVLPNSFLVQFKTHLNHVTRLLCIGYGFGDIHINQALRDWLESRADRQLEIVAPNCSQSGVPSCILHLSTQVTLTNSTASDFLS
jgi:hypothetical protein